MAEVYFLNILISLDNIQFFLLCFVFFLHVDVGTVMQFLKILQY